MMAYSQARSRSARAMDSLALRKSIQIGVRRAAGEPVRCGCEEGGQEIRRMWENPTSWGFLKIGAVLVFLH